MNKKVRKFDHVCDEDLYRLVRELAVGRQSKLGIEHYELNVEERTHVGESIVADRKFGSDGLPSVLHEGDRYNFVELSYSIKG